MIVVGNASVNSGITGLGLIRTLNQAVVTSISAGYETMNFGRATGRNFAGPTLEANLTWYLSDVMRLDLTARRQAYQSFFINNNFYANSQLGAKILRQVGRGVYLSFGATYHRSDYSDPIDISVTPETPPGLDSNGNGLVDAFESFAPSQGLRRRDGTLLLEAGVGFQLRPTLRAFIGYNFDRRNTNVEEQISGEIVDPLNYQVDRLIFRIEAGWL